MMFLRTLILFSLLSILSGCGKVSRVSTSATPAGDTTSPGEMAAERFNTEAYDYQKENAFVNALTEPQSTFSIDVDTASYSNIRRLLGEGRLPPKGAIRIEELVNYFDYEYPEPSGEHPFSVNTEVANCPWQPDHRLLRIGLKGKSMNRQERPACNLVFLLDVSGSMMDAAKLPLVKSAMKLLVPELNKQDRIAIAVYAGASGLALPSTAVKQTSKILDAIDELRASGSTNGAAGIQLAYQIAEENFIPGGINRVILCTDGDFNVGTTSQSELVELISAKAKHQVFLTVLGFGDGNLNDSTMEKLADHGNGNYAYIDNLLEARKVLVEQCGATLMTIAKDVKIQVDFNPRQVQAYRLLGYENRVLANQDFRDDAKDAGEIGAGHCVTAFYEIIPASVVGASVLPRESEFVTTSIAANADSETLLTVNLRYQQPTASASSEFQVRVDKDWVAEVPSKDFQFAAAVIGYGMLLRHSTFKGNTTWDWVVETAEKNQGGDLQGIRSEFAELARTAQRLSSSAQ